MTYADEIFGADHPIDRVDKRLTDVVRPHDADVIRVEEQDEDARAAIFEHRPHIARAVRLDPRHLRSGGASDDVLELLDLLRRAFFEDRETPV
jgi:hypothetical protein